MREVLPTNVHPLRYAVTLEPDFEKFTFEGEQTIDLEVKETTRSVTVNSLEIDYHEVKIDGAEAKIDFDTEKQRATFTVDKEVKPGKASVYLRFTGQLNDKMAGFYRSLYQENGKTKYLATTQMEPTDCRRAFPSFDEPALKAKFDIALISDKLLVHLSNMPAKEEVALDNGRKKTIFETTPLMSTYLVAFIVGDLRFVSNDKYRVPIKVWATPGEEHLGQYAADIAAQTLAFFDKKFDIEYPLPKLDMVAVHDFSAGAMENFGLITYRTVDLLLSGSANVGTRQRVTEVVMHELAHQWFGNLVTMDFWDGLWLNEGFATWMSWYACDSLFPEWKVWELYVADTLQHALNLDALRLLHPIEVPVQRADEINQIFDAISYLKGSSLLKMLSKWLGEETFIKGVSAYLKKHMWGNTQTLDLWEALASVSGKDVVAVMDIWTKKVGFPVVKVEEKGGELHFTQHRFLATGDATEDEDATLYPVFLGIKTETGIDDEAVLDGRTATYKKSDFFKVNANLSGVYRTVYSPERWAKLGEAGVQGKLSVEDRVGLVADAAALAALGYIRSTDLLSLVRLWRNEENYVVWESALNSIGRIRGALRFEDETIHDALDKFVLDLVGDKLKEVGWLFSDKDLFAEEQMKLLLFGAAAGAGHPELVAHAQECFKRFVEGDKNAIHPNIRAVVFGVVAKTGDDKTFDQLFAVYKNPQSTEEKLAALRSLGRIRNPLVMEKVTGLLLQTDVVKPQDIYIPMGGLRSHRGGIEHLWRWLKVNWDAVYELLPPGLSMLGLIVQVCTGGFTTMEQKKDVEDFFAKKDTKGFDQGLAQSLDLITALAKWAERDAATIKLWLVEKYPARL